MDKIDYAILNAVLLHRHRQLTRMEIADFICTMSFNTKETWTEVYGVIECLKDEGLLTFQHSIGAKKLEDPLVSITTNGRWNYHVYQWTYPHLKKYAV